MSPDILALIITGAMLVLFITQILPLPVTAMLAAFVMAFTGLIDMNTVMSQFGTSSLFCVLGMMVVGASLFETGLAQLICQKIFGKNTNNRILFIVVLITAVTVFSSFLSNTTTTAMFLPVVAGMAATADSKITKKNSYILVGYAANIGGCMTLMGSPTQHQLGQNLLAANGIEPMPFFYGVRGTLIMMAIMIAYFILFGNKQLDKLSVSESVNETQKESVNMEIEKTPKAIYKMIMSGIIMVTCIVLIATKVLSSGAGALLGSVAVVLFGCIDLKTALSKINLEVVMLLGGLFAVSEGFNASGAGERCVNAIFNVFGEDVNRFLIYAIIVFVAMILTNVIDNIAAQALIGPIAIAVALRTGINPTTMVFSVLVGCNIAYLTPISTPCITMTLDAGYKFTDYIKIGWPLSLASYLGVILLFPAVYGF